MARSLFSVLVLVVAVFFGIVAHGAMAGDAAGTGMPCPMSHGEGHPAGMTAPTGGPAHAMTISCADACQVSVAAVLPAAAVAPTFVAEAVRWFDRPAVPGGPVREPADPPPRAV